MPPAPAPAPSASHTGPAVADPRKQAALHDAALALGVPAEDAGHFARTGALQVGEAQLLLLPLAPHPHSPWLAVVQRPRPAWVAEPAWLDTLLQANAKTLLAEDAAFALADNGDTVLLQHLPGVDNALLLSAALYGALLLSESVQPATQAQATGVPAC